jgi:hypothetical protein
MENADRTVRRRFRPARIILFAILLICICCYLYLYVDSLHQRRKAESLIADLRAFPFATAGPTEVREFATRHGGVALPECTTQDCTFRIEIYSSTLRFRLTGHMQEILLVLARDIGVRSWGVWSFLQIRSGRLYESVTYAGELRRARCYSYTGLVSWGYEVRSLSSGWYTNSSPRYSVGFQHIDGPPSNTFAASFPQAPNAPITRAFDIRLDCLTRAVCDCRGFGELAPSAWTDYLAKVDSPDYAECH